MSTMAANEQQLPKGLGTPGAGRLRHELRRCGVRLPAPVSGTEQAGTGASKLVDAAAIANSPAAADQVCEQVFDILVRGEALSVSLGRVDADGDGGGLYGEACGVLARALREAGARPAQLEIVVEGGSIEPRQAALLRCEALGRGIVHILTHGNGPGIAQDAGRREAFWRELWRCRSGGMLRLAYKYQVTTPCPLLADEAVGAVLPQTQLQVPVGSAWLQFGVNLGRFPGASHGLCEKTLEQVLRACVELGESLHDDVRWPTAQMRADAWMNRRLGIAIHGLGDLVLRKAMDPRAFSTFEYLGRLLQRVRHILWDQSRAIALRGAHVPAIERTNPGRMLPNGARRDDWHRRWSDAVASAAIRHRNLLVLSPWSVFPEDRPAEFRFADLLPVLRFADGCTLAGAPDLRHWNVNTFKAFHLRACAVLQQRDAAHQIAERC